MAYRYVRARVTSARPIRDVHTRESVGEGGIVTLRVREPGTQKLPPCPRHPKKGVRLAELECTCGSTLLEPLLATGAIELVTDEPAAEPVKAVPKADKAKP